MDDCQLETLLRESQNMCYGLQMKPSIAVPKRLMGIVPFLK